MMRALDKEEMFRDDVLINVRVIMHKVLFIFYLFFIYIISFGVSLVLNVFDQ